MQQTRDLLELYKILLEVFNRKEELFICRLINGYTLFSEEEKNRLKEHFLNQYPTESQYATFYNHRLFNDYRNVRNAIASSEWFIYEGRKIDGVYMGLRILTESESFKLRVKFLETIISNFEKSQS